MYNELN